MGLIKKSILAAAATKAVQLARKPENQQRAREFIASRRRTSAGRG